MEIEIKTSADFKQWVRMNICKRGLTQERLLRYKYNKLSGVERVLHDSGVAEDEFLDCINFLSDEGYIELRQISSKHNAKLADIDDFSSLEAKLTSKGIRLLAGGIDDNMIEV